MGVSCRMMTAVSFRPVRPLCRIRLPAVLVAHPRRSPRWYPGPAFFGNGVASMEATPVEGVHAASGATVTSTSNRIELARCLNEAAQLPGIDLGACEHLRQKLSDATFNLVVAGQFKRGKSSVINALLADALLPVGVIPLTSIVTVVRFGDARAARAELQDGREQAIPVDALEAYVTERGNPNNAQRIRQVLVDHPSPWLANGVRLVDTPGIGSVYEHNTDVARQYLPQADAVLFIASVDQPLGRAELDFLVSIRQYADKIFCLLNKTDHLRAEDLRESVAFATDQIHSTLGASTPLFPISATLALEGKLEGNESALARSGFPQFERTLQRFMTDEKNDVWLRSVGRNLLRILSQMRFTLGLESATLTAPQQQIDANLAAFTRKKLALQRSGADYQVLLESDAKALFDTDIEPRLAQFKRRQQQGIGAAVEQWHAALQSLPSRKLQAALEERLIAHIRAAYDGWLGREDALLCQAFESLCTRVWSDLQSTVDELIRYSSELFCVEFEPVSAEARWTTESGFYYKFWYEPTSLRILSTSFVLGLPKSIAGRLIVRRIKTFGFELIETQAGRIRHDLHERLKKSVRDTRRQIATTVESIIARIEAAIESGVNTRRHSEAQVSARARELASAVQDTTAIEARVRALFP